MNYPMTHIYLFLLLTYLSPTYATDPPKSDQIKNGESTGWCWKDYAVASVVGGTVALATAPWVLSAAGFTAGGVAVGSLAAGIQSAVYGGAVTSGSVFAGFQSAGAAGIGLKAGAAIFTAAAAAASYVHSKVTPCAEATKCTSEQE